MTEDGWDMDDLIESFEEDEKENSRRFKEQNAKKEI